MPDQSTDNRTILELGAPDPKGIFMNRSCTSSVNLFPEFVFVITVMLIIYGAIFDKYEDHPVLALSAFCLSIYL